MPNPYVAIHNQINKAEAECFEAFEGLEFNKNHPIGFSPDSFWQQQLNTIYEKLIEHLRKLLEKNKDIYSDRLKLPQVGIGIMIMEKYKHTPVKNISLTEFKSLIRALRLIVG